MHKGELLHPQDQFQNIVSKYGSQYYKNGGGETFRTEMAERWIPFRKT